MDLLRHLLRKKPPSSAGMVAAIIGKQRAAMTTRKGNPKMNRHCWMLSWCGTALMSTVPGVCLAQDPVQGDRAPADDATNTRKGRDEAEYSVRLLRYGVTVSAGYGYFFTDAIGADGAFESTRNASGTYVGLTVLPVYWFSSDAVAQYCAKRATVSNDADQALKLNVKQEGKEVPSASSCVGHWLGFFIGTAPDIQNTYRAPATDMRATSLDEGSCTRGDQSDFVDCRVGRAMLGLSIIPNALIAIQIGIAEKEAIESTSFTAFVGVSGNADLLTRAFGF